MTFRAWLLIDDKKTWDLDASTQRQSGWHRVLTRIDMLVHLCQEPDLTDAILMIDLPAAETKLVDEVRDSLRRSLRLEGRHSFRKVKPCPDHRIDGLVVQIADMLAGAANDDPDGVSSPFQRLGARIAVHS